MPPKKTESDGPVHEALLERRLAADLLEDWSFFLLLPLVAADRFSTLHLVAWFSLFVVIHVGMLSMAGTTPFKWIVGIGVRSFDESRIGVTQATIRAAVYLAPRLLASVAAAVGGVKTDNLRRYGTTLGMDNGLANGIAVAAAVLGGAILLSVAFARDGRGIADKAAGTVVVKIR